MLRSMIFRIQHRDSTWIDLERPTEDEVLRIAREFPIGERIKTELLSPTPSSMVAADEHVTLSVLHFPAYTGDDGSVRNQEVDFIVGRSFIITVRYEVVAPLQDLRKTLETEELVLGKSRLATDTLLEVLFVHLYEAVRDHTHHLSNHLSHIEAQMFAGHERGAVRAISDVNRAYLHLEAALTSQEEPLSRFLATLSERGFFGASFKERAGRIEAERLQVDHLIRAHRALASELRETNAALLATRQNEIMKTLTVVNFIFLPLELIAFVFGMHALGTPLEQNPHAFLIIMALMLAIVVVMTIYFARKRWIF